MANNEESNNLLNDTFNSAKELLTERFSSPFIFSYIVSWLLIHYQAVIIIFTDSSKYLKVSEKIDLVEMYVNNTYFGVPFNDSLQLSGFTWALIAAGFYTFLYPFFDYLITWFTLISKVELRNLRVRYENKLIYSPEDMKKKIKSHNVVVTELNTRLDGAEAIEEYLRVQIKDLEEKIQSKPAVVDDTSLAVLEDEAQLEQAKLYVKQGDLKSAEDIIDRLMIFGDESQRRRAKALLKKLNDKVIEKDNLKPKTEINANLSKDQKLILNVIGERIDRGTSTMSEADIKMFTHLTVTVVRLAIDKLFKENYIKRILKGTVYHYSLDSKGLEFYVSPENAT